ncbi:kelch domain-containing protein 4 [Chrysoperla carnea]|uniref:kelch domain-containing protein 4 n=1 Tax=Chrysoperla carnea TaxID=189513 RepID=UPI001D05D289|nr:kelch domain-containing protein 4 [Chrysoperla carnea]
MGKKDKNKKKGKGAEKTATKTEKKLSAKQKKELAAIGEESIEAIVAQIEKEEKARQKVVETVVSPPSRRSNFSFVSHPDKDELILFGGEYFNGQKTFVYNDLFFYNIPRNEWTVVKAPGGPAPVCGHQMVVTSINKGQLWVFGGEFTSATQSQFYHYRDLWVYHLHQKKWEKITAPGGPSARSGHRMVCLKKQIIVFGGFHDNLRDYKYFNDVYAFNLETYQWTKLDISGIAPPPRSGCNMVPLPDGKIAIFGGYSRTKLKKDVDKGQVHNDFYLLTPDKHDTTGTKWKFISSKQGGIKISPRCSMPITCAPNNKAYTFGGVFDVEENEEDLSGKFFNDLHCLDLEKLVWRTITLNKKSDKPKRRRKDKGEGENSDESGDEEDEMEVDEETAPKETTIADDGIFTVKIGPSTSTNGSVSSSAPLSQVTEFWPSPRMNCGMAIKRGILYIYGGMIEDGDKQLTLNDLYSLDLHKLDEWKTVIKDDLSQLEWFDSESEGEDESSGSEDESGSENEDESDMETD